MFINTLFSPWTIDLMHESMKRLLDYAKKVTAGTSKPVEGFGDIAAALTASSGKMTNWKSRGISKEGAIKAEAVYGCAATWLLTGETPHEPIPVTVLPPRGKGEPRRVDFQAREVSDSDWALLQDLRVMPEDEIAELRMRAARNRANVDRIIASRMAQAAGTEEGGRSLETKDSKIRGISLLSDLDDQAGEPGKEKGAKS